METLQQLAQHLTGLGLAVRTDGHSIAVVGAPQPSSCHASSDLVMRHSREVPVSDWSDEKHNLRVEDPCRIELCEDAWRFQNDGRFVAGAWNHDIIRHDSTSLLELANVIERYYFCSPLVLSGWVVPLHQHPAWRLEELRECLHKAAIVPVAQLGDLLAISRGQANQIPANTPHQEASSIRSHSILYRFRHVMDDHRTLCMRYDCTEAFICQEPTTRMSL